MERSDLISGINERELIGHLCSVFSTRKSPAIMEGAGSDDCAVIDISDEDCLVITTDMLHRKTDFPEVMSAWQIGWMAAAVNLSDVASMGATPVGFLSALGITDDMELGFAEDIARGMDACASFCDTSVIGGDIDLHDELTITGTALGRVKKEHLLRRRGAIPGDLVCVTGNVGSAGAALLALQNGFDISDDLLNTLLQPVPRTKEGQLLASTGCVTSMMDTSDGLAMSLYDLAETNGVGFIIFAEALPIDNEVISLVGYDDALELGLYTGGDFELLFTVSPSTMDKVKSVCYLNVVGEVTEDTLISIKKTDGINVSINRKGYVHMGRFDNL
ncbi:thiamine-phosphate kinase [Methanococcoides burtonii]|uniref:Thiamine-monophosphate kinase n=1 Tax=Methanococcoides burtonii (strain DSM 6242 / NBRC 107633 / OCM 468 / ACE-M) TaxID=259564 RepID=Q12U75_METBU|nr:thiamine-phosphate kinase [Methanococcoides burtonii]ABE53001.1 Thiamine-monophosphate kinase [Methanococcoides burtonii DSM 6242]